MDLKELIQSCSLDSECRKVCESNSFWLQRFKVNNLPLVTPQSSLRAWIDEVRNVHHSMNLATYAMRRIGSWEGIFVDLLRVNTTEIFPDYIDCEALKAVVAAIRIDRSIDPQEGNGQIAIRHDEDIYSFTIERVWRDMHRDDFVNELTREQAHHLAFLFFYYHLAPTDIKGRRILDADRLTDTRACLTEQEWIHHS